MKKSELKEMIKAAMMAEGPIKEEVMVNPIIMFGGKDYIEGIIAEPDDYGHFPEDAEWIKSNILTAPKMMSIQDYMNLDDKWVKQAQIETGQGSDLDHIVDALNVHVKQGLITPEQAKEAMKVVGLAEAIDEGLLDFLKKKKKEAPKAEDSPKLVGVDFDGNYIYSDDPNLSMNEAKEEDVKDDEEVDVDIEKDVEIDDEPVESDIEITDTEEEVTSELDGTNQKTLKALEAALESARELGDEKLINQIGNTITFFTRQHIVKEEDLFERKRMLRLAGILK